MLEIIGNPVTAFAIIATTSLFKQYYSDLMTLEVDSRINWMMGGVVIGIVFLTRQLWIYLGLLVLVTLLAPKLGKGFADGDIEILYWLIPGYIFIGIPYLIIYVASLIPLSWVWTRKATGPKPGLVPILAAHIITVIIYLGLLTMGVVL